MDYFFDFQGLKTEINIVIISTKTCVVPKTKFIFSLYRYAESLKDDIPIVPEIFIIAVSQGPRKNVPNRIATTVTIHLNISQVCLKNPQLLNDEYIKPVSRQPKAPGITTTAIST